MFSARGSKDSHATLTGSADLLDAILAALREKRFCPSSALILLNRKRAALQDRGFLRSNTKKMPCF
ncbi:hypothetical protein TRIP_B120002 [uncultured Desulfatiglans sp.]|uniref:Uncharacterized protein n=1 Tax=Uncultured Desulfatiglans sp. TaxID=1748965 RepID=A0A653A0K3_UNCDX|nr:hypothetical protein TRIP_B120002 [uncultured Desulfatiglans sp.]